MDFAIVIYFAAYNRFNYILFRKMNDIFSDKIKTVA